MRIILLLLILMMTLVGCTPTIEVSFSTNKSTYYLREPVRVINHSTGNYIYQWRFEPDTMVIGDSPTYSYQSPGKKDIIMTTEGSYSLYYRSEIEVLPRISSYQIDNQTAYDLFVRTRSIRPSVGQMDAIKLLKGERCTLQLSDTARFNIQISAAYLQASWYELQDTLHTKLHANTIIKIDSDSRIIEDGKLGKRVQLLFR